MTEPDPSNRAAGKRNWREKLRVADLACFGGRPSFDAPLHVGRPSIPAPHKIMDRIRDILDRAWLTNDGPYVKQFESQIARHIDVKHCVCTCSGTTALQLAIRALGMEGEVIVPSMTFAATAHALAWQRISPVFADADPTSWNVDPSDIEQRITSRTTGIIGVHLFGEPCDVDALQKIADRHDLHLMFDASHAFGCKTNDRSIGGFGEAEVFSFHATKFVHATEGGAVVTNDDALAEKLRATRNFGFDDSGHIRSVGTNGKMSELAAAVGLTCLEHVDELLPVNASNQLAYQSALSHIPGICLRKTGPASDRNMQYVVLEIDSAECGLGRDDLLTVLRAERILAKRYFYPGCHRLDPYSGGRSLPHTERLLDRVLVLPNGPAVRLDDIERISHVLKFCAMHGPEIRQRLRCGDGTRSRIELPHDLPKPYVAALGMGSHGESDVETLWMNRGDVDSAT